MWGALKRRNCSYCGATTASEGSNSRYFLVQWEAGIVQGQRRAVAATFCLQRDIHKRAPMHTAHSCGTDDHHESQDKIHQAKEILIYKTVLRSECIMQETIALCWAQALSALGFFLACGLSGGGGWRMTSLPRLSAWTKERAQFPNSDLEARVSAFQLCIISVIFFFSFFFYLPVILVIFQSRATVLPRLHTFCFSM